MTKADMDRGTVEYLGAEYFQDPYAALEGHMLNSDPPDHERLRRLVNKAFTPRRVEQLRPRIAAITAELLDEISTQREVDLLASFAFPLPITVICELVGIPAADRDDFRKWSATIISNTVSVETFQADATAMVHYFMALLAAKRHEPADDLLSALILARDEGDRLDENEHYCLGAPLARLEAEIAFGALLDRFGSMELAVPTESLRWRPSTLIHGLEALPVRLFPAG
jgi:cytochrome P450